MVGITPPLDPAHALRADPQDARSAITIAKLAALMPAGAVSDMVGGASDGARVTHGRPGGVGTGTATPAATGAQADIRQSLSTAARVILDILESTPAAPMRSAAPVVPGPPAVGQAGPLASALAQQLGQSGAFYESHLQQWLQGTRSLDTLMREPQAALGRPAQPAARPPTGAALLPYDSGTPARILATSAQLAQAAASASLPDPAAEEHPAQPPTARFHPASNPDSAAPAGTSAQAHLAQQVAHAYQAELNRPSAPTEPTAREALLWGRSAERDSARSVADARQPGTSASTPAAPVHADAVALVRQQLDILATQQWRWSGEAWPGTPMDWQIVREHEHPDARREADSDAAVWSTRLLLEFPNLGKVEARLRLSGNGLDARLAAPESVNQLHGARAQLQERLGALGLNVHQLTVNGIFWPEAGQPA
ncbi:conserved hypothetical protein [Cupriavidus taiwanensis]|uniref:Flagellar hook-length control protein-like C-terminal domain-containing protein n=1 Tax=Cupriavidus taiwanensis TaxID=164546 RepID=A0A976FXF3_9BURK|nr:flagellar hook-length control protein FliK [Cupriavidus taiwanensis]SOY93191.1 conserved hypothetical protein [Cupriavidus taiwanensis]SOY96562.1 conserved hypothetical protein [Cupriavidus taiwanensis]SPD68907.1 conserved protein of unknown function [Cupriavidus taiwanensis]